VNGQGQTCATHACYDEVVCLGMVDEGMIMASVDEAGLDFGGSNKGCS
jgi:hypothetical protein